MLNVHKTHKAYKGRGVGGGGGGQGVWRWGKREIIYLSLRCHLQNDSYINMDSDKSNFNVLSSHKQDSVHRPQFLRRKESRSGFEPRSESLILLTSLTPYR